LAYPTAISFGVSVLPAGLIGWQVLRGMGQGSGSILGLDDQVDGVAVHNTPLAQCVMVFEKATHEDQH
jgi:hypothetical protein